MDKVIKKKKWTIKKVVLPGAILLLVILLFQVIVSRNEGLILTVNQSDLTYFNVTKADFLDYITVSGNVKPVSTIQLDTEAGGKVEEIYKEEGELVTKDEIIATLSNTDLVLDIMNREAALAENINNLRNTRLSMDNSRLNIKKQLLDLAYSLECQQRKYQETKKLWEKKLLSKNELEECSLKYNYLKNTMKLLKENAVQDSVFRSIQITQLENSVKRMQKNFELVKQKEEKLKIKAPVSGQLTLFQAKIGERKQAFEYLGKIDDLSSFILVVKIDEYYVNKVFKGLSGNLLIHDESYPVIVSKVYPEVREGKFKAKMIFKRKELQPKQLRIGQQIRVDLELGRPEQKLLVKRGSYYQVTGGRYIYKLNKSGEEATKVIINLGRQNPDYFEVLSGLKAGDKVIISSYDNFGKADKLKITD